MELDVWKGALRLLARSLTHPPTLWDIKFWTDSWSLTHEYPVEVSVISSLFASLISFIHYESDLID